MKHFPCIGFAACLAISAHAATQVFTNTVTFPPGNPPAEVSFNRPQFNPADGTLNGVLLSISGFGISAIRYTNSPGSGAIVVQTNAISVLANHSNVVFLTLAVADWTPGIMEKFVVPKFTSPPQAT